MKVNSSYSKVDLQDMEAVIWLQLSLARLMPGSGSKAHIGMFAPPTEKAIRLYQLARNLPVTGQPDGATLQQINRELSERGLTV